ncbi:MAG: hypothetical protein LDLANPLL_01888 [Turneriella sp.]|nr:hypothetical protein [Turneriella sp.]
MNNEPKINLVFNENPFKKSFCSGDDVNEKIILAIQTARLINHLRLTIMAEGKYILEGKNNESLEHKKFATEIFFTRASYLAEIIKNVEDKQIANNYRKYHVPDKAIQSLETELNRYSKGTIYRNLIFHIRDKIMFHFDRDVITETWSELAELEEVNIYQGNSTERSNMFFTIVDTVAINFLIKQAGWAKAGDKNAIWGEAVKKYQELRATVAQSSLSLMDSFEIAFNSLIKDYAKIRVNN